MVKFGVFQVLKFIARAFAVLGFLVTLTIVIGIAVGIYSSYLSHEPETVVLRLDFDRPIVEQNSPSAFNFAMNDKPPVSLINLISAIDAAGTDPHVKGIVAHFGSTLPALSDIQEIRDALARFRAHGKFTYAFGTSYGDFGMSNRPYYLASAFENIWLQPVGSVGLTGTAMQSPFAKDALDKWGVKADFMQRDEFKSAMDMGTQNGFTPPVRKMMTALLTDMTDQVADGIASSRGWKPEQVKDLMARGPFTSSEALKEGLVTKLAFADNLDDEIKAKVGKDATVAGVEEYTSYPHSDKKAEKKAKATIALIYGVGLITEKASGLDYVSGEKVMDIDKVVDAFNKAADDENVKAILFRVNSPGGSPEASETIRHALIRAKEKGKPVFVSMGAVAASGGYWIAMDADHIVASPGTITGSIGVIGGKFVVGGLAKKLDISIDTISTNDNAGLWSIAEEFSPAQRVRVKSMLDETYDIFTQGVAAGRKIPAKKIPDIAKGRVWSGKAASTIGLVDELGGFDVTLHALKKKLSLAEGDQVTIQQYPRPETLADEMLKLARGAGLAGVTSLWRSMLAVTWQQAVSTLFHDNAVLVSVRAPTITVQ